MLPFGFAYECAPSRPTIVQLDQDYKTYRDGNDEELCMFDIEGSFLFSPIVFILDIYTKS